MSSLSFHPNSPQAFRQQRSQQAVRKKKKKKKSGKNSLRNCAGVSDQTQLQHCGSAETPRFSPYTRRCSSKETQTLTLIFPVFRLYTEGGEYVSRTETRRGRGERVNGGPRDQSTSQP